MNSNKLKKTLRQKIAGASFTRKAIAVCALSIACGPIFAQQGFDFGLKGIVQTSSLINKQDQAAGPELDYKNNVGIAGGISVGYSFTNHLGAEINILSSKQGQGYIGVVDDINGNSGAILSSEFKNLAQANNITFTGNYTARIDLHCIKIPILFRYTGNNTKKVFFSSFIGPQINMLSSVNVQINGKDAPIPAGNGLSVADAYKKTTLDLAFGFGAGLNLTDNLVLSVHLRLDYGMGDVENKSATYNAIGGKVDFYGTGRSATNNATGGGLISLNYKLIKKTKEPAKKGPATKATPTKK